MRPQMRGFATLTAVALFVLAIVLLGNSAMLSNQALLDTARVKNNLDARSTAWTSLNKILVALNQTWNPDEVTFDQWVEQHLQSLAPNSQLVSLSAQINLNSISPFLLQDSELVNTLMGKTVEDFTSYRSSNGPFQHLSDYKDYFQPAALNQIFCVYSFFNVNTADEIMIDKVLSVRTGSESVGATIRDGLREYRTNQQVLSDTDWDTLLGSNEEVVGDLVSTKPELDVNTASIPVLQAILRDPDLKVSQPDSKLQILVAGRVNKPWNSDSLAQALGTAKTSILLQYLGTRTYFIKGEIPVEKTLMTYIAVITYSTSIPSVPQPRIIAVKWSTP